MTSLEMLKPLTNFTTILLMIQSIVWFFLPMVGILFYTNAIEAEFGDSYHEQLSAHIIKIFFNSVFYGTGLLNIRLYNHALMVCCAMYMVTSSVWFCMAYGQRRAVGKHGVRDWATTRRWLQRTSWYTLLMSVYDLVLFSMFLRDYFVIEDVMFSSAGYNVTPFFAVLASGTLMTLALRGFVLWFINIGLSVGILYLVKDLDKIYRVRTTYQQPQQVVMVLQNQIN